MVVLGSHALGWWAPLDPVFSFVLLLQWAVPTANQMQARTTEGGTLASLAGPGPGDRHVPLPRICQPPALGWASPQPPSLPPTAPQNLASMHGSGEAAVGTLIFWQWVAALVAVPAWMTAYLWAMDWAGVM